MIADRGRPGIAKYAAGAIAIAAILLSSVAGAQNYDGVSYTVETPREGRHYAAIERGRSATVSFRITAHGAGYAFVAGRLEVPEGVLAQYTFVPADARCESPVVWQLYGNVPVVRFRVGPLAVGEGIECSYRVTRRSESSSDLGFYLCDRRDVWCQRRIRLGSLPDLALHAEPVPRPDPDGLQYARITVHNRSTEAIQTTHVHTGCAEFGGGMGTAVSLFFEYDFPGACPRGSSEPCVNFTGQNFGSYGFAVGPIAPQSSTSCLVGMRPLRIPGRQRIGLSFYGDDMTLVGGGTGYDANTSNNAAEVGTGNLAPLAARSVTLGREWHWLIAGLVLAAAALYLRRS